MPKALRGLLASKKAWVIVAALAGGAVAAATGGITWPAWLEFAKWAVSAYVVGQGIQDGFAPSASK